MSISSYDDTASTELNGDYDSLHDPDMVTHIEDNVNSPDSFDIDGDVHIDSDGGDDAEEDAEEEDIVEQDEEQVENKDENEDDSKEPRTISQGEMVNTSADDVDTIVDNQLISLPDQSQQMR
jgi:hypothetical protein